MDRPVIVNPPDLPSRSGSPTPVVAERTIHLGSQIGEGDTLVEQFDSAAGRIVGAMRRRRQADDLVSLVVYTTRSTSTAPRRRSSARPGAATSAGATRRWRIGVSALMEP